MRNLEILGAAGGEVTGSALVGTTNSGTQFLVDAGMYQGTEGDKRNRSLNGHDPNQLSAILVTHAHLDHLGRLPHLAQSKAPIYMTPATLALAGIALRNADALSPGQYPKGSVDAVLQRTIAVPYGSPIKVDGLTATFRNAGHILGSASVEVREKCGEITVFSGDLGNTPSRTVQPTTPIEQADIVIMETTYGDRRRPEEDPVDVIMEAVEMIKKNKGTLLIPAFAIDRTQIVLNILKGLREKNTLGNMPVFLDTPMGVAVTKVYDAHSELLNDELNKQHQPFGFRGLITTKTGKESLSIHNRRGPKIIIAGSGMMSGGRITRHAENYLPKSNSVILFVGYPAEGTPSRAITDGEKMVQIDGGSVSIAGTVLKTSGLSAHADQDQLLNWLRHISVGNKRLREVILVHGDNQSRKAFAHQIKTHLRIERVSLPAENEIIDLQ